MTRAANAAPHEAAPTECLNCGAGLQGAFCHVCGQSADDHHRPILHLVGEVIESFTHFDGRLANSLPMLLFRPGRLASDHIEGRRTRHVPPLRLFLITLLIFMLSMEATIQRRVTVLTGPRAAGQLEPLKPAGIEPPERPEEAAGGRTTATSRWLEERIGKAVANPELFLLLASQWAHRLAILALPLLAAELTCLYALRRRFYVYDHLIVSMLYLSFCFLLWGAFWLLPASVRPWLLAPAVLWTLANLTLLLRGAYGSGLWGAAAKAALLWVSTLALFGVLVLGLLALALNQL